MDIGLAFSFPFQDEEWITKLVLAAVIMLIPILGMFLAFGWMLAITRNVIKKEAAPLEGWSDFGGLMTLGFKGFVIALIYMLPILVISVPFGFITSLVESEAAEVILAITSICFSCLTVLYALVFTFVFPAAMGELAATDDLGAALNPSRIFELVRKAPSAYILTFLGTIAAGFLSGFGVILCFVGIFFTVAYAYAVYGHLYGQAYLEATA